jgi:hypothetical protein
MWASQAFGGGCGVVIEVDSGSSPLSDFGGTTRWAINHGWDLCHNRRAIQLPKPKTTMYIGRKGTQAIIHKMVVLVLSENVWVDAFHVRINLVANVGASGGL